MVNVTDRPPSLAELQRWLGWVFTDPRGVAGALADPRGEPQPSCLRAVVEAPPLTQEARLDIYAEAYFARLVDALAQNFPALRGVLGEDLFRVVVSDYLQAHPSTYPNIEEVGHHLAEFLRVYFLREEFPFLPDLAALEWVVLQAFYADDCPLLEPAALATVPQEAWPAARMVLGPSVHLLRSAWPVDDIWEDRRLPGEREAREWEKQPCTLVIHRREDQVRMQRVSDVAFRVLEGMASGETLGVICEAIAGQLGDEADWPPLMVWFSDWIAAGILRRVEFPPFQPTRS